MSLILSLAALSPQLPPLFTEKPLVAVPVVVDFQPGPVTCGGMPVAGTVVRPMPSLINAVLSQSMAPFELTFRISEGGRPLGIATAPRRADGGYVATEDLQPSLAASQFAPGAARASCAVRYSPVVTPIESAAMPLLRRYYALPHARSYLEDEVQKRIRAASPGCFAGAPIVVLLQAFPDYATIPQPQGALSMTVVGYDIDASGRPTNVRTEQSEGNAALDSAGRDAIARSRYGRSPRTGCTYPFYRRQRTPLAPPPPPSLAELQGNPACDTGGQRWDLPPRLTFPEPFRRRAIEGWAVIRYDVAPWGQTGNVTVLASEPAAIFGEQARQIIQTAKRTATTSGATGCIDRVFFKLPEGMERPAAEPRTDD